MRPSRRSSISPEIAPSPFLNHTEPHSAGRASSVAAQASRRGATQADLPRRLAIPADLRPRAKWPPPVTRHA